MRERSRHAGRGRPGGRRLAVLFEDDEVIVVDKPAGLLTIATATERVRTAYAQLYDHVKRKRPPERIFIVHRLDREASGLLVFAKTEAARHRLQDQFKTRAAGRTYVALVEGRIGPDAQTLRSHLIEGRSLKVHSTAHAAAGKLAVTHLRVLRRLRHTTLVEVRLESGRKHQIRAHLAERGHPIVGDARYGSRTNPLRRLGLHATRLEFRHPRTGEVAVFRSPCPFAPARRDEGEGERPPGRPPLARSGPRAVRRSARDPSSNCSR
jgi:23S rRNA pseudouridine1911/1915/1917 synthase